MPTVEFHTGVAEPVGFACRLLRKACQQRVPVLVIAAPELLDELDQALWTFDAQSFLPHVRLPAADAGVAGRTPIWLATQAPPPPRPAVLLNLGADELPQAGDFERVIEVIGLDDAARRAGRQRWRHYEQWGVRPKHHASSA